MNLTIRRANETDAAAIVSVIRAALGDDVPVRHVAEIISLDDHLCYAAQVDDRVVGFVDGFSTIDARGRIRYELDLLGVTPSEQGQGIGQSLVSHFVTGIRQRTEDAVIRALVSYSNKSSQRVMMKQGFTSSPEEYDLFIKVPEIRSGTNTLSDGLTMVRTLSYKGIWIERPLDESVIAAADRLGNELECNIIGSVLAIRDSAGITTAVDYGFERVGRYHWWMLT
jgi:ribosomal protein S18 acetylase RimI-like enzyme